MPAPKVSIIISDLNAFVEKTMVALALQVIANLVAAPTKGGTPVDTGWARANWAPNIGTPLTAVIGERPKKTAGTGRKRDKKGKFVGGAGGDPSVLLTYRLGQGPIFITNNVPYIKFLNEGSSKQAPAGFIQAAVARATKQVKKGGSK